MDINVQITIGGTLTQEGLADLLQALSQDRGAGTDWDEPPRDGWAAHIAEVAAKGQPLIVTAQRGRAANFAELEQVCVDYDLPHQVASDGDAREIPAFNSVWRPGMSEALELGGNIETGPAIYLQDIRGKLGLGVSPADILAEMLEPWEDIPPLVLADGVTLPTEEG